MERASRGPRDSQSLTGIPTKVDQGNRASLVRQDLPDRIARYFLPKLTALHGVLLLSRDELSHEKCEPLSYPARPGTLPRRLNLVRMRTIKHYMHADKKRPNNPPVRDRAGSIGSCPIDAEYDVWVAYRVDIGWFPWYTRPETGLENDAARQAAAISGTGGRGMGAGARACGAGISRKNEILGLTWDEIDEAGGVIRLSPARSKTLVGRILPISHPIAEALARRRARRDPDSPLVFHRDGIPVRRWRTAWRTACQAAGVPTRFLHDCRRTAARNLIRASVPERVAMLLTGHKSRAIFDRYNIINEQELLKAGDQLVAYLAQHAQALRRDVPETWPATGPCRGRLVSRRPGRRIGVSCRAAKATSGGVGPGNGC